MKNNTTMRDVKTKNDLKNKIIMSELIMHTQNKEQNMR